MTTHTEDFLQRAKEAKQRITEVSPAEARDKIVEGALLLDLREKDKFELGHIKGALNISPDALDMRIGEVAPDKHAPIVCYCGGSNRAALTTDTLQQIGYTRVVSIQGGLKAYEADDET
ncbi:MAG: rhodanese-like domain-containing protein [Marinobacter sp.]|uniref:rhodanese-like domain-containing protein n=1 Tax=Marinobacter sp. TaxID=50741 RepID=UPI00349FF17F